MRAAAVDRDRATQLGADRAQLHHPFVDLSRCLGCGTRVKACPEEGVLALVHGQATVENGACCVGHAACERECPVGAITVTLGDTTQRTDIPALDASLEAERRGLRFVTIDQEDPEERLGGTVAKYPRRKLVLSEPVELPLHGRIERDAYAKEALIALWESIARRHDLPIRGGEVSEGLERDGAGRFVVRRSRGRRVAGHVCLAVGGGGSAVEAALALFEQEGHRVTLSYRKGAFFRMRARNEKHPPERAVSGRLELLLESEVREIRGDSVLLAVRNGRGETLRRLESDDVFVMAGGIPPFALLGRAGVSFDASKRPAPAPFVEQGTGLLGALAALVFGPWHLDDYRLPIAERPTDPKHNPLRPGRGIGLAMGIAAAAFMAANLFYLLRRSARVRFGSLRAWISTHVARDVLASLCATLHSAMAPRDTVGGDALLALGVLLVSGPIRRYFYAYVPGAASGRELKLFEVRARLARVKEAWGEEARAFRARARAEAERLVEARRWRASFFGRLLALVGVRLDLRRLLVRLVREGRGEGVPAAQVAETVALARRAHAAVLMAAHYEDLRALLGTWRFVHRWVAALVVLLLLVHVAHAVAYGAVVG